MGWRLSNNNHARLIVWCPVTLGIGAGCDLAVASLLCRNTSFSDAMRIKKLAQAQTPHWCIKNKTGKDCTRLIYLNSSAGHSENDKGVLGTGKIGTIVGCVIGQQEANKAGAIGSKDFGLVDERRSSLTVKTTGAPMRRMIDWIVGTDETALDVALPAWWQYWGPLF